MSWLHRHAEVLGRDTGEDGRMHMTVRVDPDRAGIVRAKFGAQNIRDAGTRAHSTRKPWRGGVSFRVGRGLLGHFASPPPSRHSTMRPFRRVSTAAGVLPAAPQRLLDEAKAPLELGIGRAQRGVRISPEMAGEIDHCEHQIADFTIRARFGARPAASPASRRLARPRSHRPPRGSSRARHRGRSSRSRLCRPSAGA